MRQGFAAKWLFCVLVLSCVPGCGPLGSSPSSTPLREPGFRASTIRRPALLVRVSVSDDLSQRERSRLPEDYQAAVVEGLDRIGILAVDAATLPPSRSRALEGIERAPALARAREAGAEYLVIVDARLSRGDLVHCRQSGRALTGPTTHWDAALEIDRVSDGKPLLVEPAGPDMRVVDVELDCRTGKLIRRRSMDELIGDSVDLVLAPFNAR
ncbi:MAG TPA: hypothetical protein VMI34_08585 [Candidatus Bathyarchaeia archaeon]|nr:hypothetical protein [Candidatus Bathyarchaeia archaeon]